MSTQGRRYYLKSLLVLFKLDVGSILLDEVQAFASKLGVGLLVVPKDILGFLTSTIVGSDWRMMRHLLR